jgi:ADP-ribose pyrophosphatase
MAEDVEILGKKRILDSFLKVDLYNLRHSAFNGGWVGPMTREVVARPTCVAVLPYDPVTDQILLIEQFRLQAHLTGLPAWQREVVAGINDKNESEEEVARREALEEANCPLTDLWPIYRYLVSPGLTTELLVTYLGRFDSTAWRGGVHGLDHEHEDIRATLHDASAVPGILENGHTGNGPLIIILQWFLLNRDKVRQKWR